MTYFAEMLNHDFYQQYRGLNAMLNTKGGVVGYIAAMESIPPAAKRSYPYFDNELNTIKACHELFLKLREADTFSEELASEDDIDLVNDLIRRIREERDPLTLVTARSAPKNNPDAEKYMPIEAEAREVSRRVVFWQKHRQKLALASAALLTLTLAIALKIRKGLIK